MPRDKTRPPGRSRGTGGRPASRAQRGSFVGSPPAAPAPLVAHWAQFRELVTGVGDELAAFLRDHAALLRPVTMGEEEFAVILGDYAAFLRKGQPNEEPTLFPLKKPGGVLGWTDEERAAHRRDGKWPERSIEASDRRLGEPPPLPRDEKLERLKLENIRLQLELRDIGVRDRALAEPEVRKALARGTPGRRAAQGRYDDMAVECLNEAGRDTKQAQKLFLKRAMKERRIQRDSARNRWCEAMQRLLPSA